MMAPLRVLIVGSEGRQAAELQSALRGRGLAVEVSSDREPNFERTDPMPDLLVLDVAPKVGDVLCRKAKKKRKDTSVILLAQENGLRRSPFGANPDAVLRKPVSITELLRQVETLLGPALSQSTDTNEIHELDQSAIQIM